MDKVKQQILEEMGITLWNVRAHRSTPPTDELTAPSLNNLAAEPDYPPSSENVANLSDWQLLQKTVSQCQRCSLGQTRKNTVFGSGATSAHWMFIGEAPGAEEDRQGEPFVGRAGQLLTAMIVALGMQRESVFIANVLKCRPPENRDPMGEEVVQCSPYLLQQIQTVQPRMIVSMGRFAAQALLQTDQSIGQLRGRVHHYGETGIPMVATYHPAYLLRSPLEKRKAWQDLQLARETYRTINPA
ncbi:MAG: uracil-DNA glycosylase family 4 [Parasphingorhabdus sp.]|jgi:uracil-DNA glycosylase family 4